MRRLQIVDSHTGGEPTRVVIGGGPELSGSVAEQLCALREGHDWLRRAVVNEPRGSDVTVGALLCAPADRSCTAGVIFFNNVGYLGMCGHGTIGLMVSLAYLGRIAPGAHRIETPVGIVEAVLHPMRGGDEDPAGYPARVSVRNMPSYRYARAVSVAVDGIGRVTGDVAWGGNWFFLVHAHGLALRPDNVATLAGYAGRVRDALRRSGITGAGGAEIDHIELFGPGERADSRNFVLCPGGAYDRSPCGTGTSAKLACLYADGELAPGQTWRQESITGSVFEGRIEPGEDGCVIPTITGEAFVTAEGSLLLDPRDPFWAGREVEAPSRAQAEGQG